MHRFKRTWPQENFKIFINPAKSPYTIFRSKYSKAKEKPHRKDHILV